MSSFSKFKFWAKKIVVLTIIILVGIILYRLYNPVVQNYLFLQREKGKLLRQKDNMLDNAEILEGQIKASEEEAKMEASARLELNMKKEGEGVILVSETTTTKAESKNSPMALWERIKSWFFKKN